jgi:hypothetical protein
MDNENKNEETIYEDVIRESDGWKTIILDISKYAKKNITFKIEGWAGGSRKWCGEIAAVNKFYIGEISKLNKTIEERIRERLRELGYVI